MERPSEFIGASAYASAKVDLIEVVEPVTVKNTVKNIQGGQLNEEVGDVVIEEIYIYQKVNI